MIGLLMLSVIAALGAGVFCLVAGYGLLIAVTAYIGVGLLTALLVAGLTIIRQQILKGPETFTQSHV